MANGVYPPLSTAGDGPTMPDAPIRDAEPLSRKPIDYNILREYASLRRGGSLIITTIGNVGAAWIFMSAVYLAVAAGMGTFDIGENRGLVIILTVYFGAFFVFSLIGCVNGAVLSAMVGGPQRILFFYVMRRAGYVHLAVSIGVTLLTVVGSGIAFAVYYWVQIIRTNRFTEVDADLLRTVAILPPIGIAVGIPLCSLGVHAFLWFRDIVIFEKHINQNLLEIDPDEK